MKRLIAAIVLALVYVASASAPASADPVRHFSTFTITCAGTVFELVSKPGSSTVVTVNGVPSNSVSVLMGLTITVDGVVVFEFHKPYTLNQSDRIAVCTENGDPPGVVVVAEVKFTPGP
ncbi:MAG: hypothetical protein AABM40_15035 [Chloroflexota bacterium]